MEAVPAKNLLVSLAFAPAEVTNAAVAAFGQRRGCERETRHKEFLRGATPF